MSRHSNNISAKLISSVAVVAVIAAIIPWYAHHLRSASLQKAEFGDQAEALHAAESSVAFNPMSIQNRFVLAGAQQRLGREVEARNTLVDAVSIEPLNYMTWEQLGIYERSQWNNEERAREYFAVAIMLNPYDQYLKVTAGVGKP
jgi:tetratricopeptide (TPR) repeat protein